MVLMLIAEVLAGETLITPGGAVDMDTACGLETFTWDRWLEQLREGQPAESEVEVTGSLAAQVEALTD